MKREKQALTENLEGYHITNQEIDEEIQNLDNSIIAIEGLIGELSDDEKNEAINKIAELEDRLRNLYQPVPDSFEEEIIGKDDSWGDSMEYDDEITESDMP